jgi:hypothetical protein
MSKDLGEPIPPGPRLEYLMQERPQDLVFPLDYFVDKFAFDAEDIRKELAAGRLVAETNAAGQRALARGKRPKVVVLSLAAIRAWIAHPQTPLHLIDKIIAGPLRVH